MTDQKLSVSQTNLPEPLQGKYLIKRIDEDDIEITLAQRSQILQALSAGVRFIEVKNHILMLNSIKSIDPKWGEKNIPPRPKEIRATTIEDNVAKYVVENKDEIELWEKYFGNVPD